MDRKEIGCEDVDWIHLSQESPVVGSCEHGNGHVSVIEGRKFLEQLIISLSRRTLLHRIVNVIGLCLGLHCTMFTAVCIL
jgi:hypothetical protein